MCLAYDKGNKNIKETMQNKTLTVNTQDLNLNDSRPSDKTVNDDVNEDGIPETHIANDLEVHWDTFSLNL